MTNSQVTATDDDDDIEASLPTSRLLISNSTTTTTLASNDNNNNYYNHSANNNIHCSIDNSSNQAEFGQDKNLDGGGLKEVYKDEIKNKTYKYPFNGPYQVVASAADSFIRENDFNGNNQQVQNNTSTTESMQFINSTNNLFRNKFKKPKLKLGNIMMRKFNINMNTNNVDSKNKKKTYIKRYSNNLTTLNHANSNNNNTSSIMSNGTTTAAAAGGDILLPRTNGNGLVLDGVGNNNFLINNNNREEQVDSNLLVCLKLFAIFSTIYFFMWSSSILSQAFNLTSYHYAGNFIRTSGFLQNPLIGLMVGVITTVIFQSSGAVTSVLVTIVGSGVLSVRQSIPIIMGANLGTSVTNTVVSLIVYRKKENFEIAMTAGIVHDMYNMMSVVFMLPIELLLHPLEMGSIEMLKLFGKKSSSSSSLVSYESLEDSTLASDIVGREVDGDGSDSTLQFLSYLVKPLVDIVILIDKDITTKLNPNVVVPSEVSLVKRCCNSERIGNETICHEKCFSLFSHLDFSDSTVCLLLLVIAMLTLFTCLVFVVKVTKSLLGGKLLNWVAKLARKDYKYPCKLFVGYLFILVGMIITVILHSSGVFTSMLVPLAGGDVLNLMQIYELTLGSNVGTTTTGILAALSAQSKYPLETLQVALCHFLFNLAGILMFYTIPGTKLPIWASKRFGTLSAKNMWFSIGYLIIVFLVAPALTLIIYFATIKET